MWKNFERKDYNLEPPCERVGSWFLYDDCLSVLQIKVCSTAIQGFLKRSGSVQIHAFSYNNSYEAFIIDVTLLTCAVTVMASRHYLLTLLCPRDVKEVSTLPRGR